MKQTDCGFPEPDSLVRFGPTLKVLIGFDPHFRPDSPPGLAANEYHALVDTGASDSCIDSVVASALKLPVIDRINVAGAHGSGEVNVYLAQIKITALDCTIYGRFAGVHLHAGGQPHSALIGRTFLRHMTMEYNGKTGSVTIRF